MFDIYDLVVLFIFVNSVLNTFKKNRNQKILQLCSKYKNIFVRLSVEKTKTHFFLSLTWNWIKYISWIGILIYTEPY